MILTDVIYLRSDIEQNCSCGFERTKDNLGEFASHIISKHGYKISHAGQETNRDPNGNPWQSTVMVLVPQ